MIGSVASVSAAGDLGVLVLIAGCLGAAIVSTMAWARADPRLTRTAGWLLAAAAIGGVGAVLVLAWVLVTSDFTVAYVVEQSRDDGPAWYRLAGLWGGMAGSLLVWTVMMTVVGVIATRRLAHGREPIALRAGAQAAIAIVAGAFGLVLTLLADPFVRLAAPAIDGRGLTPILEHPAMLYHPPLLYAGLTALAAPFALTIGASLTGRLDQTWLDRCRRWALVPWVLLGAGMVAGAHWAYVEVGWGGFWAWDPVENTALLPWLALTAFLHAGFVRGERGDRPTLTAPVLVVVAFLVALLGTMLTRSGATQSVHAFAEDPAIGWALLAVVVGVGVAAGAILGRADRPPSDGSVEKAPPSIGRNRVLRIHVAVAVLALAIVLAGTTYPLLLTLLGRDDVAAVDAGYFASFVGPLALIALALAGVGPRLGRPSALRLGPPVVAGLLAATVAWAAGWRSPFGLAVAGLGGFAATASVVDLVHERRPVHLAHLGLALLLVGIAGSATGASVSGTVAAGGRLSVAGYEIRNEGARVVTAPGDGIQRVAAPVTVIRDGDVVARLTPEVVVYRERGDQLAETALWSSPWADVQVALRDADDDGRALLQVHVRPLLVWVWWGGLLVVAGGGWALVDRRRRHVRAAEPFLPAEPISV